VIWTEPRHDHVYLVADDAATGEPRLVGIGASAFQTVGKPDRIPSVVDRTQRVGLIPEGPKPPNA